MRIDESVLLTYYNLMDESDLKDGNINCFNDFVNWFYEQSTEDHIYNLIYLAELK